MKHVGRYRQVAAALTAALVVGSALAFAPAPSADGSGKIVFTSVADDGKQIHVYVMDADGSHRTALTKGDALEFDPVLSHDGQRIAFVTMSKNDHTGNVWVMGADGSGRKQLTENKAGTAAIGPCWSPDGKHIAYSRMTTNAGQPPEGELVVMDADGKNATEVGKGLMPTWSPDGKKILYTVIEKGQGFEPRLTVMDADGKNVQQLFTTPALLGAWSPDGKRIAYMGAPNTREAKPSIHVANADGSESKQLTKGADQFDMAPRWSADGKRIYFSRMPAPKNAAPTKAAIWVMDADGQNEKELTKGEGMDMLGGAALFFTGRAVAGPKP
jgi:Tol biopolymer transport system component